MIAQVEEIGRKVAAVSTRPKIQWQFKVIETKEVNALSVPGFVYVNSGLIDFVNGDTDALAGVIAHEVGHTCGRHAAKSADKQLMAALAIQLFSKKGNARQLGNIAANLALLGYSRKDEFEADKFAVDFMTASHYDANGMVRFFEKLKKLEGKNSGSGVSKYFRTHPPTSDRINKVKEEMVRLGQHRQETPPAQSSSSGSKPHSMNFAAVRAAL
jgi:predicted Zn-dependent protease